MKKTIFMVCFLLFIFKLGHGQEILSDTLLNKYSYMIGGVIIDSTFKSAAGTCFFVKRNGNIYLITAAHVLSGCDRKIKQNPFPTSMYVELPKKNKTLTIDLTKYRDTVKCENVIEKDYVAVKLDSSINGFVNTIEDFIKPEFKKFDLFEIIGRPIGKGFLQIGPVQRVSLKQKQFKIFTKAADDVSDSTANYYIVTFENNAFGTLHGFSGSPVYLREQHSNKIRILGCFSKGRPVDNGMGLFIGKIDFILSEIDNQIFLDLPNQLISN